MPKSQINRMLLKGKKLSSEEITNILINLLQESEALVNFPVIGVNAVSLSNAGVYCSQEFMDKVVKNEEKIDEDLIMQRFSCTKYDIALAYAYSYLH